MNRIVVLHHTKLDLTFETQSDQSLAAHTHMLNFKSELTDADFVSFLFLNETKLIIFNNRFAPWFYFRWLTILLRLPFCFFLCYKYDRIIIYHSKGFYFYLPVFLLFRNKIILQVNEVYSNVTGNKMEIFFEKFYISTFKRLIVSNIHLKERWFPKREILLRGGYFRQTSSISQETKKNYIYVGSIDEYKMGNLQILLNLISSIPESIKMYLCLIISDIDFKKVEKLSLNKPNILVYRNLNDLELQQIYLTCKYGLVLQDSSKPFNITSFPSKVFSYLNNGLIPVAQRNDSFINSEISTLFRFINDWQWAEILSLNPVNLSIAKIANELKKELIRFVYK
jgi:hypothetical protein